MFTFVLFGFFLPLFPGLKGSLQRLQLEYVDVVFANRPDSNTPMEGEWRNWIKDSRVIDSNWMTYFTNSRKWNIFRLIWLNGENGNLSHQCLLDSAFTLKARALHLASSFISEVFPGIGTVASAGNSAHFFQVHFTSAISSTETIKLIGRGVYNPAIVILEEVPWWSSSFVMTKFDLLPICGNRF